MMHTARSLATLIRACAAGLAIIALVVLLTETQRPIRLSLAEPTAVNFGRPCFDVIAFGADPHGLIDSTSAFRSALLSSSQSNGVAVCAPAGNYLIENDLTLFGGAPVAAGTTAGGPSLYGAGPGLTVLEASGSGNVFDSCPSYSNVTPSFPSPSQCPMLPSYPSATAYPNSTLSGVVLSGFSITHVSQPAPSPAPADFYFPSVQGVLIENVCVSQSVNVFDFGQQIAASSFGLVTVRDSTCGYGYTGHFMAFHGGGTGVTVTNNLLLAGGRGLVLDTTDVSHGQGNSVSTMRWFGNTVEQPFIGQLEFIGAAPMPSPTALAISDQRARYNVYDACVFACYYFGLDASQPAPGPAFHSVSIADQNLTSLYDAIYLDGSNYSTGGVQNIHIGGPSSYAGANGGTGGSIWMVGGSISAGDAIYIIWNPTTGTPISSAVASTGDTPNVVASALAQHVTLPTLPMVSQVNLANTTYGLLGMSLRATPAPGSYTAQPFKVVVTGGFRVT
jgi:hypothetical protein